MKQAFRLRSVPSAHGYITALRFMRTPSQKTILANGGKPKNTLFDPEEQADVKRFWIEL